MSSEPINRFCGTPLSEWIASLPDDLDDDAVGLWEIIPALQHDFGLHQPELELAARRALAGILARGAQPVVGTPAQDGTWQQTARYGDSPDASSMRSLPSGVQKTGIPISATCGLRCPASTKGVTSHGHDRERTCARLTPGCTERALARSRRDRRAADQVMAGERARQRLLIQRRGLRHGCGRGTRYTRRDGSSFGIRESVR
jgi:hypothetical protein